MTRGTTASATSAEDSKTTVERRWMSVVFLQGEEADEVLDMIERVGPETAIHHLSQWDYGDETRDAALVNGYVYDEIPQTPTDRVIGDKASDSAGCGSVRASPSRKPQIQSSAPPRRPPRHAGGRQPRRAGPIHRARSWCAPQQQGASVGLRRGRSATRVLLHRPCASSLSAPVPRLPPTRWELPRLPQVSRRLPVDLESRLLMASSHGLETDWRRPPCHSVPLHDCNL